MELTDIVRLILWHLLFIFIGFVLGDMWGYRKAKKTYEKLADEWKAVADECNKELEARKRYVDYDGTGE